MKVCIGVTRRAVWKPLDETFVVVNLDGNNRRTLHLGGWTEEGKKIRLELDADDVAKIVDRAQSFNRG